MVDLNGHRGGSFSFGIRLREGGDAALGQILPKAFGDEEVLNVSLSHSLVGDVGCGQVVALPGIGTHRQHVIGVVGGALPHQISAKPMSDVCGGGQNGDDDRWWRWWWRVGG